MVVTALTRNHVWNVEAMQSEPRIYAASTATETRIDIDF